MGTVTIRDGGRKWVYMVTIRDGVGRGVVKIREGVS